MNQLDYEAARACQLLLDRLQMGDDGQALATVAMNAAEQLTALARRHAGTEDDGPGLAERTETLYRQINFFPEAGFAEDRVYLKPDAYRALLDLRQVLEREVIPALYKLDRR